MKDFELDFYSRVFASIRGSKVFDCIWDREVTDEYSK